MKVSQEDVDRAPNISGMIRRLLGKTAKAIAALRFSSDPIVESLLQVYDRLPVGDRDLVPLEAICIKAEVTPPAILGALMICIRQTNGQESALKAMIAHPKIVDATVRYAKLAGGDKDRKMLHESIGFLPTKQGGNINVNLLGGGQPKLTATAEDEEDDDDTSFREAFPTISGKLEGWSESRRKLLENGKE
jgi:hypothetical protein